ncbi:Probable licABCH operon regulator [Sebaldella termitidis]|jgi:mannitol operon transcriptional antiterminator|uniref:Transcriptional antiterminator, BglG n=1 Tax=Sebaldella termitidis (strain ATCC 33386 / NCTC 11300) TaxID=526218 RepID=D1AHU1_SEBTE|nr:PTS sugar transporter subunit IIA [Sebaldella termitidis]ACZ08325.1 transcriptional antiterminator, BglG [Sebaldella termitidis ATCC 33386]SUI23634.1 Probable licABCH operon regulator [Sebaldella termitidis]
MIISSRTIKILEYVSRKGETTIRDIGENLLLSERIVRYEIDNINFIVSNEKTASYIINKRGRLHMNNTPKMLGIIEDLKEVEKVSKHEREDYIFIKLLFEGKINLRRLTEELDVSRTTVKKDLASLEMKKTGIEIVNNSLCFPVNDEFEKRKLLIDTLDEYIDEYLNGIGNNIVIDVLKKMFSKEEQLLIEKFLKNISEHNLKANKLYKTFYMYLIITIQRIRTNNLILKNENANFLKTTEEYQKINKEIILLEKNFEILFTENEKLQIADFLTGLFSYSYNTSIFDVWIKINIFIKEIIKNVGGKLQINLEDDVWLLEGLMNHIKPAIYRIRNNINLKSMEVYYEEAREIYPRLFTVIKEELKALEKLINIEFPENELLLFLIHFQAALERNKNNGEIKNVLLVCIGGFGTTNILAYKLQRAYELNEIKIISYLEIDKSYRNIDAVITTADLNINVKENISVPVIKVSPFLTEKDTAILNEHGFSRKQNTYDISEIVKQLNESASIKNKEKFRKELQNIFSVSIRGDEAEKKDLFYFLKEENIIFEKKKLEKWEDAVKEGFKPLEKGKYVDESYYKSIIELINNFGSYMVVSEGLAIPHAENMNNVHKSGISLLYLKHPVIFPGNKKVNLLFCLSAVDKKDHVQSLEDIIRLEEEFSFRKKMAETNSKEEITEILDKYKRFRR